jgi:hypothetical protein
MSANALDDIPRWQSLGLFSLTDLVYNEISIQGLNNKDRPQDVQDPVRVHSDIQHQ